MQNITSPTLQDVLDRIDEQPAGTRKRDLKSAVRGFCKAIGKAPREVPASPQHIRSLAEKVAPLSVGLSERRWANIYSGVTRALGLIRHLTPSRNTAPISPEWQTHLNMLPHRLRRKLSAAARHFSTANILPSEIALADLEEYCGVIVSNRMRRNAEKSVDEFIWGWNRTVAQIAGWPQIPIPREDKRYPYSLPFSAFPPSFQEDVKSYTQRLARGPLFDLDDDDDDFGPLRPVRPATVATRARQIRAAASALAHSGTDPRTIASIAVLVEIPNAKKILNFYIQRNPDQGTSGGVAQMATLLAKVALHHVKAGHEHHLRLKRLAARVAVRSSGMTGKNRERLRPFDDSETVADFVCLPDTIRKKVQHDTRSARQKALLAQMAAAIAIQIAIPLRIANLASLDIHRHFESNRNGVYLVIPEAETKNREPINFQIPAFALEIVKWYIREHREHLMRVDTTALFPGRNGGSKAPHTLGLQIKQTIFKFTGLTFNVHLFRHTAGKIFLDANPGNYEVVRQLLRHKSITTTTSAYSGAETRQAGLLYAELVESLRAAHQPSRGKRKKAA